MSGQELTPVQVSEMPWEDPLDGLFYGTYRVYAALQADADPDHLEVYIRGEGDEYRGRKTVCGRELHATLLPARLGETCSWCLDGISTAFREARAAMAMTETS